MVEQVSLYAAPTTVADAEAIADWLRDRIEPSVDVRDRSLSPRQRRPRRALQDGPRIGLPQGSQAAVQFQTHEDAEDTSESTVDDLRTDGSTGVLEATARSSRVGD